MMNDPIPFRFKFVNDNGDTEGFLSKKGELREDSLILGGNELPLNAILQSTTRFKRIILILAHQDGSEIPVIFEPTKKPDVIYRAISSATSRIRAEARMQHLMEMGEEARFKAIDCVHCSSVSDLTDTPDSVDVYCEYCDTIQPFDGTKRPDDSKSRICDSCSYFGQPSEFSVFYFYFLLVIYGWRSKRVHMCNSCMRGESWKMFFANLIFILGVPFAIIQLIQSYFFGSAISKDFKGLDTANTLARKGKTEKAMSKYNELLTRVKAPAGIHYNMGMVQVSAGNLEAASEHFSNSLKQCANYSPSLSALTHCFSQLGQTDKLAELKRTYHIEEATEA